MPFLMIPITSSNTIVKGVISGGGEVDFSQFYQIFSYFINRFVSRFLLILAKGSFMI